MTDFPSDVKINKIILEILSASKCVYLQDLGRFVIYKHPTSDVKIYLDQLEITLSEKYRKEGFVSEDEINEELTSEFFTTEDEDLLSDIESKLKAYDTILKKRVKGSVQYIEDHKKVAEIKRQRDELLTKKDNYKQFTAEYKAREEKYFELLCQCSYELTGERTWKSVKDLFDFTDDLTKIYTILNDFLGFYLGYEPSLLRYIARHPFWRNYYISSDKGMISLFSRKTEDLSIDQLNLLAWSSLYSDINQMPLKDRPSKEIIANDDLLDQFLEEYNRKTQAEAELERQRARSQTSKALNHSNVVVTPESGNYISFQKQGLYSDPKEMTNRVNPDSTAYDEAKRVSEVKKKVAQLPSKK